MARVILALSLRQTFRNIGRSTWTIVGSIVGLLYAAGAIFAVIAFSIAGRLLAEVSTIKHTVAILGLVAWAVWLVVAFIVGLQQFTGPEQFALLPVRSRDLTFGLLLSGICGITGVAFTLSLLGLWIVWSGHILTFVAAVIVTPLALVLWFLLTRIITDGLAARTAERRVREIIMAILLVLFIFAGLTLQFVMRAISEASSAMDVRAAVATVADVLQWLPPVAPVAIPGALATGDYLAAFALLCITLVSLGFAWLVWSRMLSARLTNPIQSSGASAARDGSWIDRLFPASAWGAVAARRVRYLMRDARHQTNLALTLALGAGVIFWEIFITTDDFSSVSAVFAPVILCLIVLSVAQSDLAYDGEAFGQDLLAGITGRADRIGRVVVLVSIYLPIVLIVTVTGVLATGSAHVLTAALGINIGGTLIAIGVGLAVQVFFPGAAPPPGGNPFGKGSGGDVQTLLGQLIGIIVCVGLNAVALGFGIWAFWQPWAGVVSLVAGLIVGCATIVLAISYSAKIFEKRGPANLAHMRKTA